MRSGAARSGVGRGFFGVRLEGRGEVSQGAGEAAAQIELWSEQLQFSAQTGLEPEGAQVIAGSLELIG